MNWNYYDFKNGFLYDEDGYKAFDKSFANGNEAENWLVEQDIRGTVR